jgi:hypothetical protein
MHRYRAMPSLDQMAALHLYLHAIERVNQQLLEP